MSTVASMTRKYFAYSTILDPAEVDSWMAKNGHAGFKLKGGKVAEAVGVEMIYNFQSLRWGGRVAGLMRKPGASLFGVLYELDEADWQVIVHAEGAKSGKYMESEVQVKVSGAMVNAVAFTTRPERVSLSGPVSESFEASLIRGAEQAGLPAAYITKLKAESMIVERVQAFGQKHHLR